MRCLRAALTGITERVHPQRSGRRLGNDIDKNEGSAGMRRYISILVCVFAGWMAAAAAQAAVTVQVVDSDPKGELISLGRDEPFYLRMKFATDEPVQIWARPYYDGKLVRHAKSHGSITHTGKGYALGWFSLDGVAAVNEVRIKAGGGKPYREWEVAVWPVSIVGTGRPTSAHAAPAWVAKLRREEEAVRRAEYEKRMNEPTTASEEIFISLFMLSVVGLLIGGFAAPAWGLAKWRGGWRMAAAVPAVLMGFVVLRILIGVVIDPTSHNLWPFELLIFGAVSLGIMFVLWIVRRFTRTKSAEPAER